ncbi:hypothetical protein ElyMa_001510700 [Elysia marginata]|uniref:Uncharacterized protein n=1 Tax=Elysia marginata TaxID=1093978 RepID=A0AAV4JBQ3_9GAST|nr:hypothetical protein ElyMa_001510700 [Elysia marginata]
MSLIQCLLANASLNAFPNQKLLWPACLSVSLSHRPGLGPLLVLATTGNRCSVGQGFVALSPLSGEPDTLHRQARDCYLMVHPRYLIPVPQKLFSTLIPST